MRHDIIHETVGVPEHAAAYGDLGAELPVELLHRPRLLEGDPVEAVDYDVVAVREPIVHADALGDSLSCISLPLRLTDDNQIYISDRLFAAKAATN